MRSALFVITTLAVFSTCALAARVERGLDCWTFRLEGQDSRYIELRQEGNSTNYSGCTVIRVHANFRAGWKATVQPGWVVTAEKWEGFFKDLAISGKHELKELVADAGQYELHICARATKVNHMARAAGRAGRTQTVGVLTVWIVPQPI